MATVENKLSGERSVYRCAMAVRLALPERRRTARVEGRGEAVGKVLLWSPVCATALCDCTCSVGVSCRIWL